VLQSKFLCNQVRIAKIVILTLIALAMIYPWRRVVLPTSEMSEGHLEESIKHELLQMDRAEGFAPVMALFSIGTMYKQMDKTWRLYTTLVKVFARAVQVDKGHRYVRAGAQ